MPGSALETTAVVPGAAAEDEDGSGAAASQSKDRRWIVLPVLCLSVFLVVVDNTIVNVALPTLNRTLGASITSLQWIVDAYSLAFAGLLLAGGGIGDRLGRKGTMQIGLVFFGVFSAAAAWSHTTGTLISTRALMGVAAAFIFPASLAILTSVFPDPSERQKALGIWGATSGIAVAFGPIVGGALLEHFWYGSIFLVNVPIVIVTLVAGGLLIPRLPKVAEHRFDIRGVLISTVGITMLVLAIIEGPQWGWASVGTLACFAAAAVLLTAFALLELRTEGPAARRPGLQDPALHGRRAVDLGGVLLPLRVHLPHHPVLPVRQGVLDPVRRRAHAAVRHRRRRLHADRRRGGAQGGDTPGGHDGTAADGGRAGGGGLQLRGRTPRTWGPIMVAMVLLALGLSSITAPTAEAVMGSVADEQRGAAAGVNNTTRELGWHARGGGVRVDLRFVLRAPHHQCVPPAAHPGRSQGRGASVHGGRAGGGRPRAARGAADAAVDRLHGVPQRIARGVHRGRRCGRAGRTGRAQAPARAGCSGGGAAGRACVRPGALSGVCAVRHQHERRGQEMRPAAARLVSDRSRTAF